MSPLAAVHSRCCRETPFTLSLSKGSPRTPLVTYRTPSLPPANHSQLKTHPLSFDTKRSEVRNLRSSPSTECPLTAIHPRPSHSPQCSPLCTPRAHAPWQIPYALRNTPYFPLSSPNRKHICNNCPLSSLTSSRNRGDHPRPHVTNRGMKTWNWIPVIPPGC